MPSIMFIMRMWGCDTNIRLDKVIQSVAETKHLLFFIHSSDCDIYQKELYM